MENLTVIANGPLKQAQTSEFAGAPPTYYLTPPPKDPISNTKTITNVLSLTCLLTTSHFIYNNTTMNVVEEISPPLGPTQLAAGHAPPTPPHESALDDIYGSSPTSLFVDAEISDHTREMLSDLPSRQRALDADAYREGLASAKSQYVQEGFDEGYALGADLGLRVGYILGVLRGFVNGWKGHDQEAHDEVSKLYEEAQKELAIEQLLNQTWVDEEGIWKWEVNAADGEATFREVAAQHPMIKRWDNKVEELATGWGIDLNAVEKMSGKDEDES